MEGEKVLEVDLKLGYNYRGIMKLAEGRSYWQNLYLFERVCGICSAAHTTAYTRTVEMLGEIEIPDRACISEHSFRNWNESIVTCCGQVLEWNLLDSRLCSC